MQRPRVRTPVEPDFYSTSFCSNFLSRFCILIIYDVINKILSWDYSWLSVLWNYQNFQLLSFERKFRKMEVQEIGEIKQVQTFIKSNKAGFFDFDCPDFTELKRISLWFRDTLSLKSGKICVVNASAKWCAPCRQVFPFYQGIAYEKSHIAFCKGSRKPISSQILYLQFN